VGGFVSLADIALREASIPASGRKSFGKVDLLYFLAAKIAASG
jgi:hypothetical protein